MGESRLVNRNITAGAGRTSMRLEPEVWEALREICLRESLELRELIRTVEETATSGGRTSAVRVHVLQYFRAAATFDGHVKAGHGTTTATGPLMELSDIEADYPLPPNGRADHAHRPMQAQAPLVQAPLVQAPVQAPLAQATLGA